MRILVLTSVYKDVSLGNRDTSTNIVNSFVNDWKKQGHEVLVIHNSHCYPRLVHEIPSFLKKKMANKMGFAIADYDAVKPKRYKDSGSKIYRLPIKKYIPHKAPSEKVIDLQVERIKNILQTEKFTPDVITGHWASPQLEIISKLKEIYPCKTACVLHGTGYVDEVDFHAEKYLKNIDHLGCRSLSQSKQTKEILGLEELPFVCNSGVPDAYLDNYSLSTLKFANVKTWKFAYVGRLVAYKNIDATIKALSALENIDWQFDIVGDGAAREELEALTKQLNCEERVHFHGRVPRDEVMNILKDAHVFVMISTNEIFGLVYLEAMAASCVSVASIDGGVDGIIVDGKNGFLCREGDAEHLKDIIMKIISMDQDTMVQIVKDGYETAGDYSDSKVAQRYLECIIK